MKIEDAIQQKEFSSEFQRLAINLMHTSSYLNVLQQRFFRPYKLTVQQYNILRILRGQQGQPIGVNDLSARMIDRTSNTSRLVEKLRVKGHLERKVCPQDRRQAEVTLTEKGTALLAEIDTQMPSQDLIYNALSEAEARRMNELLDQLRGGEYFQDQIITS